NSEQRVCIFFGGRYGSEGKCTFLFYDFRGVAAGKRGDTEKALQKDLTLFVGIGCMERGLLSVEYLLYENRSKTAGNYFCSCGSLSLVPVCYDTDLSCASVSAGYVQKPVEES